MRVAEDRIMIVVCFFYGSVLDIDNVKHYLVDIIIHFSSHVF